MLLGRTNDVMSYWHHREKLGMLKDELMNDYHENKSSWLIKKIQKIYCQFI